MKARNLLIGYIVLAACAFITAILAALLPYWLRVQLTTLVPTTSNPCVYARAAITTTQYSGLMIKQTICGDDTQCASFLTATGSLLVAISGLYLISVCLGGYMLSDRKHRARLAGDAVFSLDFFRGQQTLDSFILFIELVVFLFFLLVSAINLENWNLVTCGGPSFYCYLATVSLTVLMSIYTRISTYVIYKHQPKLAEDPELHAEPAFSIQQANPRRPLLTEGSF